MIKENCDDWMVNISKVETESVEAKNSSVDEVRCAGLIVFEGYYT